MNRCVALPLVWLAGFAPAAGPAQLLPYNEDTHRRLITDSKGQVLLIDFWATWCAPCREEIPVLVGLEAKLGPRGFRLATVSADEEEDKGEALKFLQEHRVPAPAYLKMAADDDKFITFIDRNWSGALPALFLFDRQGRMVRSFIGETDLKALEAAIHKLL